MRGLPFFKPKNKPQFAGMNFSDVSSGGGGGGSGLVFSDTETKIGTYNGHDLKTITTNITIKNGTTYVDIIPDGATVVSIFGSVKVDNIDYQIPLVYVATPNFSITAHEEVNGGKRKIHVQMSNLSSTNVNGTLTIIYY